MPARAKRSSGSAPSIRAILISSSFVYAAGLAFIRAGNTRRLIQCCSLTLLLGVAFFGLKFGLEWHEDFASHLFPAFTDFKIVGPESGGARLFFIFYFISTALHGLHMLIGIGLLLWIIRARPTRGVLGALSHARSGGGTCIGALWTSSGSPYIRSFISWGEVRDARSRERAIGHRSPWAVVADLVSAPPAWAAAEFGASFLPLPRGMRPLVMLPGVLMIADRRGWIHGSKARDCAGARVCGGGDALVAGVIWPGQCGCLNSYRLSRSACRGQMTRCRRLSGRQYRSPRRERTRESLESRFCEALGSRTHAAPDIGVDRHQRV